MNRFPWLISLIFASSLLISCAPVQPKPVTSPISPGFAHELIQSWHENYAHITSVQGLAKVKVQTTEKSLSGSQVILAEKPNRLRTETLSPFGSPLLILVTDDESLGVSVPGQNVFYSGAATAENLGRFVRIPLQVNDLVALLLYQPPLISVRSEEAFKIQNEGWLLIRHNETFRQELTFNSDRLLIAVSYYDNGELFLQLNYGNFASEEGFFPKHFGVDLPEQQITATLDFSDLQTNGKLKSGIFQLSPPEGATIVSLDE